MIVYHGTPRSKFDKLKLNQKKTTKQIFGNGLYFTNKESTAISFAVGRWGNIHIVDLSKMNLSHITEYKDNETRENILKSEFDGIIITISNEYKVKNRLVDAEYWYIIYKNENKIKHINKSNSKGNEK